MYLITSNLDYPSAHLTMNFQCFTCFTYRSLPGLVNTTTAMITVEKDPYFSPLLAKTGRQQRCFSSFRQSKTTYISLNTAGRTGHQMSVPKNHQKQVCFYVSATQK